MDVIDVRDAATQLSALVAALESGAETEVVIARDGRPAARLMPMTRASAKRRLGTARGEFTVPNDWHRDDATIATLFHGGAA